MKKNSKVKTIKCAICGIEELVTEENSIDGIAPDWFIYNEMIGKYVCSHECSEIADQMFDFGEGFTVEETIYF